jgi:hypothetical protein
MKKELSLIYVLLIHRPTAPNPSPDFNEKHPQDLPPTYDALFPTSEPSKKQ